MFKAFWRRGRRVRKSRVTSAVIPVVEALDPRKLLSAEGQAVEPLGDAGAPRGVVIYRSTAFSDHPDPVLAEHSKRVYATVYGTDGDDNIVIEYADGIRVSGVAGVEDGTLYTGIDSVEVYTGAGNDTVRANCGPNALLWLYGEEGDDLLVATGPHSSGFSGGPGNDTMLGTTGNDQFDGGTGNDRINGEGGHERWINDSPPFSFLMITMPETPPVPGDNAPVDAGSPSSIGTHDDSSAAAEAGLAGALASKTAVAKKAAHVRKLKLQAKQKQLKHLKLKQAKLAAKRAALAEKRAEVHMGGRGF